VNQFPCRQLKSTVVLRFKTLATSFFTGPVENLSPSKRRRSFNYAPQQRVTGSNTAEFCVEIIPSWRVRRAQAAKMLPNLVTIELFSDRFYRMLVDASCSGFYFICLRSLCPPVVEQV
jgi:hypothetical protein